MTDLESIRKRHEALTAPHGQAHARAVMKRTAPDDIAYLLAENARLATALATAKDEERAAFSAYAHQRAAEWQSVGAQYVADVVREYGEFVEAGRHRGGGMSAYRIDIESTGGDYPPDKQPHRGMSCASSTVWCRVTRDNESTGWVECRKMPSIIKARAGFGAALATYGDVGEDVGAMFEAVTGVAMVLR